jgi:UDP-N-acetylmuramoyl-L-alanyl-D-glutamate--2,6-diaminopimelate ligase
MFFCLTGGKIDSHIFAHDAQAVGAAAVVCERELELDIPQIIVPDSRQAMSLMAAKYYGNPAERLKIVGITGTNGKTTVSYMLSSILQRAGKNTAVVGTLGIYYGKKQIAPELTTPDPIFLQKTLADMVKCGVEYVVAEISAHALYYKKDAGITYAACIFTNFTQDHLDFFDNMKNYKEAKKLLFSKEKCPVAVLNGDDALGREIGKMRAKDKSLQTVFYGLNAPSDSFAVLTSETLRGTEFMLNLSDNLCRVSLPMTGKHNVYNAMAAATCAYVLGIRTESIAGGLNNMRPVRGRLEHVAKFRGADIFVDFAHTPDGLEKSLAALKPHCKGRLICLFGCGGNRDRSKRALMGETVARKADYAVLTSDNPRYEDPLDIIAEIERGYRRF